MATLLQKNFVVTKQVVGTRWNILAVKGKPTVLLTTHMDTVPGEISLQETESTLFGRGSCDAKASLAAMIVAAQESEEEYTNFGLLFDVSEETDFAGIQAAVSLVKPEIVIVGEPTQNEIVIGQKGLLAAKIVCKGKAAHGATPDEGVSAIQKLLGVLEKIETMELPISAALGKTTVNIGLIKGGTAMNVVPDYAEAVIEWRTTVENENVVKALQENIENMKDVSLEIIFSYEPVSTDKAPFTQFCLPTKVVPYFTELGFWKEAKGIVLGPGDPIYAHTVNEQIQKEEIMQAKEIYKQMIRTFAQKTL